MTTVRIAHAEPRPGRLANGEFQTRGHLVVLADDAGHRAVPIWMRGDPGAGDLSHLLELAGLPAGQVIAADVPQELTTRLLGAARARVTGVDIDVTEAGAAELSPEVTVARIGLGLPMPEQTARDLSIDLRPRYEPRNLTFAAGLDHWLLGGSFTENTLQSHWLDYSAAARHGTAVLSAAVPQPEGFAWLAQEIFADDYRGTAVTFRGQLRTPEGTGPAGLFLRVMQPRDPHGPITAQAALADPANHIVTFEGPGDWTTHEVTAPIPDDANTVAFGLFLAGPGRIELRDPELTRAGLAY